MNEVTRAAASQALAHALAMASLLMIAGVVFYVR
jgi:hypothetical protein